MILLPHYKNKTVGVFGLGKSGLSTVEALARSGAAVCAWDDNAKGREELEARLSHMATLIPIERWQWKELDALILAPGVPLTHPAPHAVVQQALANGVPVKGDIELLNEGCPDAVKIGITGTNGKSTTTALTGHLLQVAGQRCEVGGNLGTPVLTLEPFVAGQGAYVLELSSYQLDLLIHTTLQVAVLLNITPDHLDRHGGMEGYIAAKQKIFAGQAGSDVAIIGVDDAPSKAIYQALKNRKLPKGIAPEGSQVGKNRVIPISVQGEVKGGVYVAEGVIYDTIDEHAPAQLDISDVETLRGRHNWQNAAAAYAVARVMGIAPREIASGMRSFPGLQHRMESVATVDNVRFVNDSKATNPEAAAQALASYRPIYWIAGGKPKGPSLSVVEPFYDRVQRVYLVGAAEELFAGELEGKLDYVRCGDLSVAFHAAATDALRDGLKDAVVLLSPACASFDQWASFEARGDAFRLLAQEFATNQLAKRTAASGAG
jgi:UDP-N-acetylmuramoylalanine--D-glutamate ligase